MNRIYRLVWNSALRVVQVASELSSSGHGPARAADAAAPRLRPLWAALLAAGLWSMGAPALAQQCQPTDTSACSAPGGLPGVNRAGAGGAGNGQGGGAIAIPDFVPVPGSLSMGGAGGAGADGQDSTAGGPGGAGGALGTGLDGQWVGGRGGDGTDALRAPGGGGGGGAGIWTAATALDLIAGNAATGGDGGNGGAPGAASAAGGAGGGGGGTGVAGTADGFVATIASGAIVRGGAGGAGGSQTVGVGFGGGGGGGGDGMLLFGTGATVHNAGNIEGGAGGAGGAGSGEDFNGNAGAAGAGIRALNTGLVVNNQGTIRGGAGTGNGTAGIGIITQGGTSLTNTGTIAGGLVAGGARASAVLFNGTGNQLRLQAGSDIQGALEVADGGAAEVFVEANNAIDEVKLDGSTLGAEILFRPGIPTQGALLVGSITGNGDVGTQGNGAFTFNQIDIDGSVNLEHNGATGLDGSIVSTGTQTFVAPITLLGASFLTSQSDILASGPIDGAASLDISTQGAVALSGDVGSVTPLTRLSINAGTVNLTDVNAGSLELLTSNGPIMQPGRFDIAGTSVFNAGTHDVVLTGANTFGGTVTATGGNVALHSIGDLTIGGISVNGAGNIDLASDGVLGVPVDLITGGTIALTSNGGVLAPDGVLDGSAIELTGQGIVLATMISSAGRLSLHADQGDVLQSGGDILVDELSADVSGRLDLTSVANSIRRLGDVSVGELALANMTALTVAGEVSADSIRFDVPAGVVVTGSVDGGTGPGTLLSAGTTLTVGNGGSTGSLVGNVETAGDGTLAFNRSNAFEFLGDIGGTGNVHQIGTGTTTFSGASTYTGETEVRAGTVLVDGELGDTTTTVFSGATLGGTGRIGGEVVVNDGGTLSPGTSPGTLTVGGLRLADGAILDYELGQAGVVGAGINDLVEVAGDLTLDGTLNVTDAGGFGAGVYRLMNYGGALTDNTLDLGMLPAGVDSSDLLVQTAIAGQVNLVNAAGVSVNFWDGAAGPTDDGIIQGGDGTWVSDDRSWTLPDGSLNGNWNEGFAVFGGQAGTVTVQGEQRFTGMQFMTDGYRLEAGTDGALRASGTTNLRVDPDVTATIAAPIVGDATLVKVDAGTLVLEGAFGYTGGVTVNGGRLVGDTGNLLGDILDRAELEFAQATDATYANTVSGSGELIKSGEGVLTFTGSNSYTGGTQVEAGTLRIGAGGTAGSLLGDVRIDAAGALAFDRSDNISFAGAFSGEGALDKFGAGTLWLTGDSSAYAGQATLRAGALRMDGRIGGALAVLAGTTLSGSGTLGSVDNAGTISPDGTLTLTGDYVHRADATYAVDIAPDGSSDLLDITGSATIEGGEVYVTKAPGQYAGGTRYTIVDADGGVAGTFEELNQNLPFLDMFLSYDPNHVYLDIRRNDTEFGSLCGRGTFNQCEVAKTLDSFDPQVPPSADIGRMMEQVTGMDEDTALAAFDRMSGEVHPSLAGIVLEGHALYGQTVSRRMAERREAIGADRLHGGAWVRSYGASSELDGDGNAHGADWNLHGIAVGYDAWGTEHWLVGASANLMKLDAKFRPGDRGEVDANNLSLYTSFQGDRGYLDAVGSYAWWDNETTRAVQVGEIDRTATANYRSHRFAGYLEAGWNVALGEGALLQPLVTVQYDNLASQAFREKGAEDLSLIARSDSVERLTVGAGARWTGRMQRGGWTLEPTAQARWLHTEGQGYAEFDVAFAGAPDQGYRLPEFGWRVRGVTAPQDRGLLGLGLAARKGNVDLFVDYDFQAGDGYTAHNLGAGLRYRW